MKKNLMVLLVLLSAFTLAGCVRYLFKGLGPIKCADGHPPVLNSCEADRYPADHPLCAFVDSFPCAGRASEPANPSLTIDVQ